MTEQKIEFQSKVMGIVKGMFSAIGIAILYLIIGVALDYALTQIISQYFIRECSEDCYFELFNAIFFAVAVMSVAGGIYAGIRIHRRSYKK
ncbi:MAG: hypothetical protein IH588_09135 [Anaerolineales bacterium]|nr:hypothetical protein [Anaerolineales bacterium]